MNGFEAKAEHRRGGWLAMVRFARDAELKPIVGKRGKEILYADELAATKAALAHVLAYFNGHLVASREIMSPRAAILADAESVFNLESPATEEKIVRLDDRLIRKGKVIPVQRGRQRSQRRAG